MKIKNAKLSRRLISGLAASAMLAAMIPTAVFAAPEKWPEYDTPDYPETTEGVTVESIALDKKNIQTTITIGSGVDAERVNVNLSDSIADAINESGGFNMPGSTVNIALTVVNNSGMPYDYAPDSAVIGTRQYTGEADPEKAVTTFEGFELYLGGANDAYRSINAPLEAIGIDDEHLADDSIIAALAENGYDGGIADLDDYYIAYYNDRNDPDIASLDDAPIEYLKTLYNDGIDYDNLVKETNPEAAAAAYYYFYNHVFTLDGASIASYMLADGSAAYDALDSKLAAVTLQPGESGATAPLSINLSGPDMKNAFADYDLTFGFAFSLVQGKPKTDYPSLDKSIVTPEGEKDQDDVAVGDTIEFQLESNVPNDIINYLEPDEVDPPAVAANALVPVENRGSYELTFHDDMNANFELTNPAYFEVKIGDKVLTADQYTLVQSGLDDSCDFELTLDLVALYEAGIITNEDIENATPITVTYTAQLKAGTPAGEYENTAWVSYPSDNSEEDIVTVDTYALNIFKYDQANPDKGLEGAVFTLTDSEGNTIELTTDENGYANVQGLDAGIYTLVETEAPNGYVKSDTPLTITIPADAGEDHTVEVEFANSEIPHTGGMGTTLFTIGGAAIIVGAGVVFAVTRKRKRVND